MKVYWGPYTVNDITPLEEVFLNINPPYLSRYCSIKVGMVRFYMIKKYSLQFTKPFVFLKYQPMMLTQDELVAYKVTAPIDIFYSDVYTLRKLDE